MPQREGASAAPVIEWWKKLTPLQRVIVAVLRAAMSERAEQAERKRLYEEAIFGRP